MTNEMFSAQEYGDVLVISIQLPSFDLRNSKEFRSEAYKAMENHLKVVLDLGEVKFMDSSALGTLISLLRASNTRGGELKLCAAQSAVQVLFELTRLYRVYSLFPDVDSAVASYTTA